MISTYQLKVLSFGIVGFLLGMGSTIFFTRPLVSSISVSTLIIPRPSQISSPPVQYCAWMPWWNERQALTSLEKAAPVLSTVSPVWYSLDTNGRLSPLKITIQDDVIRIASSSSIRLIPSIGNEFDSVRVIRLITSPELTQEFLAGLLQESTRYRYQGFDLDWEQVEERYKEELQSFLALLSDTLHKKKLTLSITVHARTGAENDWTMAKTYDWTAISGVADEIRIMAYDFHTEDTQPGAITPLDMLEKVVAYARKTIPIEKIVIGLPDYGYDWSKDGNRSVAYTTATENISAAHGSWSRDEKSGELIGSYVANNVDHTIWMVDALSLHEKIRIAQKQNINSFCVWRLGEEDPQLWNSPNPF